MSVVSSPIAHIRAWRRHVAVQVKQLALEGVRQKDIVARLNLKPLFVEHILRGTILQDVGPAVMPRRLYQRKKAMLREFIELPG